MNKRKVDTYLQIRIEDLSSRRLKGKFCLKESYKKLSKNFETRMCERVEGLRINPFFIEVWRLFVTVINDLYLDFPTVVKILHTSDTCEKLRSIWLLETKSSFISFNDVCAPQLSFEDFPQLTFEDSSPWHLEVYLRTRLRNSPQIRLKDSH